MKKITLEAGHRFVRLAFISEAGMSGKERIVNCRCDCGKETVAHFGNLRSGRTQSCGCGQIESITKHRESYNNRGVSPEYRSWHNMLSRCCNPNFTGYAAYGGRGIRVCERWRVFQNFLADMGRRPSLKFSIDRIDVNGNYEPSNCRWADSKQQANNTRRTMWITIDEKRHTLSDWCEAIGIHVAAVRSRLQRGWELRRALFTPLKGLL